MAVFKGKNEQTLADIGERAWLRRVRRWFAAEPGAPALPIGDDAAALDLKGAAGPLLVSTDALIEGVHFRRDWTSARDLGAKALAVNLSDLAAMAARPLAAFLALSVPPQTPLGELRDFFMGLRAAGRLYGCPLGGGDLTRAPQWAIAVTVLGLPAVAGRLALRAAARPGQSLYVTGQPGESGAGLEALRAGAAAPALVRRHRRPTPRLAEAALLARACPDLAMLDVSDGIWNDAGQLAEASGVRVELEAAALVCSPAMRRLGVALGREARDWLLFGGEDYELLLATATPEAKLRETFARGGVRTPLRRIGRIAPGRGVHLVGSGGGEIKITDRTFRHF